MAIPPYRKAIPLDQLLAYRKDLTDAITAEPVNSGTQLVALHQPDLDSVHGFTLASLTGIARPAEQASLVTPHGEILPPAAMEAGWLTPRYFIFVTFCRLMTAPVVRIECVWEDIRPLARDAPKMLKVAIDFHFNAIDDGTPGIGDISFIPTMMGGRPHDEMRFTSYGATSEGFTMAEKYQAVLGDHGVQVLAELRSFLQPSTGQRIRLALYRPLNAADSVFASMLPYITGPYRLPSLSMPEWSALLPLRVQRDLPEMMDAPAPYPMVPFECGDTYATVTDAAVELYESSRIAFLEQEVGLREWASVQHSGILYEIGGVAVMAVQFSPHRASGQFDLPDRLSTMMSWTDPITGAQFMQSANRCCVPVRLPAYDALFVLTEPSIEIRSACIKPSPELDRKFITKVEFAPRITKFTLESQLNTAVNLVHPDAARWYQLILGQQLDFPIVDLATKRAADVPEPVAAAIEEAFARIINWKKWNREQYQALEQVRRSVGGICLITGPAGTGKTLVLQALCAFFYALGLHVLVLAPANSNCAEFMRKLKQHFPDIDATRVYPASTDFSPERIMKNKSSEQQPQDTKEAQDGDSPGQAQTANAGTLLDFEMIRADLQSSKEKYSDSELGLPAKVLKAARESQFSLLQGSGKKVNVWHELRNCMEKSDSGEFDWFDKKAVQAYQKYYNVCKAHYMSLQKLVVTTTGNVRCNDIIDNYARDGHGVLCEGLVVILDEACKDREVESLSPLLIPDYRHKITGMVLLGDERQLEPTNKSSANFNPFTQRLSIPFLTRLKRSGFPCVELKEQHRMSYHISRWPSKTFYKDMRDGPGTFQLLATKQPGLFACLTHILDGIGSRTLPCEIEDDRRVRSHYLQVFGRRDNTKRSPVVREHVRFFFEHIYWSLLAYFGEKMEENVMVICAYKGAVSELVDGFNFHKKLNLSQKNCWLEAVGHLQQQFLIPRAQFPKVLTIDSSQGCEAPITIIDCSVQKYSPTTRRRDIGFVDDNGRVNVAFTRAQEVRWVLGGSCNAKSRRVRTSGTPAYVRYREEVTSSPELTMIQDRRVISKADEDTWLDGLKKQDVVLSVRYADEMADG